MTDTTNTCQTLTPEVQKQLMFVGWLQSKGLYNPLESPATMQKLQVVWEAAGKPEAKLEPEVKPEQDDVTVSNHGGIILFMLNTQEAKDWVDEHVQEPMYHGNGLAVEPRYAENLAIGMRDGGLTVE